MKFVMASMRAGCPYFCHRVRLDVWGGVTLRQYNQVTRPDRNPLITATITPRSYTLISVNIFYLFFTVASIGMDNTT